MRREQKEKKQSTVGTLIGLHLLLMGYSLGGIFSKLAGKEEFLSWRFLLYYGCVIVVLGVYAVGWQQVLKRLPLTVAFSNKAVTLVWGLIWGVLFFQEQITLGKIIGIAFVMVGVVLYVLEEQKEELVKKEKEYES